MASDLDDLLKSIRDEAKKESALVPVKDEGNREENLVDEQIDERILRLLGLEDIFDIDYATYKTLLREKMAAARMSGANIPAEEDELLVEEFRRVKRNTGRFKVKKKKIKVEDIQKTSPLGKLKGVTQSPQKLLPPGKEEEKDYIGDIIKSLDNIIELLKNQNTLIKDTAESQRKKAEKDKREKLEAGLEKGFQKTIDGAMKMIAPVKSILQKIIDFIMAILIGRFLVKLIGWFADPANQEKLKAIGQFFSDHWPKLLGLYLMFGTGLGKFVRSITGLLIKGAVKLAAAAAGMLAKSGVAGAGKFGKVAGFLGGKKGKFLTAALTTAATVGTTMAVSGAIDKNFNQPSGEKAEPSQNFSGGGQVLKLPGFFGGGLNFGDMFKGMGAGAMFGPLGMLAGAAMGGSGKSTQKGLGSFGGFVSGEKGVDKVPAMLSDGEFVMSRGAVAKHGIGTLEAMNASGGGTNKPTIIQNSIAARGGGYVGTRPSPRSFSKRPLAFNSRSNINVKRNIGGHPMSGGTSSAPAGPKPNMNFKMSQTQIKREGVNLDMAPSFVNQINPITVNGGNTFNVSNTTNKGNTFNASSITNKGNILSNNIMPIAANNIMYSMRSQESNVLKSNNIIPSKAVNVPGVPSRPSVIVQPPTTLSNGGSSGSGQGYNQQIQQIPIFSASFESRDKSRNSKILGIF